LFSLNPLPLSVFHDSSPSFGFVRSPFPTSLDASICCPCPPRTVLALFPPYTSDSGPPFQLSFLVIARGVSTSPLFLFLSSDIPSFFFAVGRLPHFPRSPFSLLFSIFFSSPLFFVSLTSGESSRFFLCNSPLCPLHSGTFLPPFFIAPSHLPGAKLSIFDGPRFEASDT